MFNIISADLYKLKKSKVLLWIILLNYEQNMIEE